MTCPGMNTEVGLIKAVSPFQIHIHHFILSLTIVIVLIVFFLYVVIIVTGSSSCGFANMGMVMHGLCIGSEEAQAAGTDKAKVVVHGWQVIHHCSLILTLFATPGVEGQATSSSQGLGGMDGIEANDLWWLCGWDDPEKVDVFWRSPCCSVGHPEVLSAAPGLLHLMDFGAQEVGGGGHLVEDGRYDTSCSKLAWWAFW